MRIISKFRDYYDSAVGAGVDMTRVYERETRYLESKVLREIEFDVPVSIESGQRVDWGCVYFCGRKYPYLETSLSWPQLGTITSFHKDFSRLLGTRPKTFYRRVTKNWKKELAELQGLEDHRGLNLIHKSPVVVQRARRLSDDIPGVKRDANLLVINECLRNLEFQRVIDPYQAFQEIDMFLSTILVADVMPATKMSDKEKVVSHGMDARFSFRHRPKDD